MNDNHECQERAEIEKRIAQGRGSQRDYDRVIQLNDIAVARSLWISPPRRSAR